MLRFATPEDGPALLEIYAQYIDTAITFEYTLPTQREFSRRIEQTGKAYPYLVCEENGRVTGYAYGNRYREREAYQWNAELSVYVDGACTARGLGRRFYRALIEMLRLQGIRTVYGIVTVPNPKSERLHQAMGFTRLGTWRSTGYKGGKWHDVAMFERQIAPYDPQPSPFVPIGQVPYEALAAILQQCD